MKIETELMRGAGPIAVLKLLQRRPMYGYELVQALTQQTSGVLAMGQSTLYPMLYNLEAKDLIEATWQAGAEGAGRDRKYYNLTTKGKKKLADDTRQWQALAGAMNALGITAPVSVGAVGLAGGAA
jgi:PadR family transcriptional regulator PadR